MFGLSLSHLVILLIVVLLFGARRLPELGGAMGKTIRNFKKGLEGLDSDSKTASSDRQLDDDSNPKKRDG